ncbi:MAG: serine hydroxymethyltransferase [Candidatus Chisholmbacteria bacterium]|nr:serine hydroxymethyltransferase [Candidatus Chisholmbacteria bacterium]
MQYLRKTDPVTLSIIRAEEKRQREELMLIPSENYASRAVLEASGSVLTNKYAEGYPRRRYYQGNTNIDDVELLAQERAKKLFGVPHANVQPYSGSPANSAVQFATLEPGDTVMGLALASGGHLTHGHPKITFSGKFFKSVQYNVGKNGWLDYDEIAKMAKREKPKLIIAGTTAYPRILDWKKFSQIAESVGAYLMADIAHIAGLVVAGAHPSPVRWVHVVTTTTHKTLRGPRGAMILVTARGLKKDPDFGSKIDRAVFPALQGGPHNHTTAGIAVALREAQGKLFKTYGKQIVKNAKALAESLMKKGFELVSGGTDNHLMLVDLRNKGVSGWVVAWALDKAGIILNYNSVPFDTNPPMFPSGMRLGTPGVTSRGMKEREMVRIGTWINEVVEHVKDEKLPGDKEQRTVWTKAFLGRVAKDRFLAKIRGEVRSLARRFPLPGIDR